MNKNKSKKMVTILAGVMAVIMALSLIIGFLQF